MSDLPTYVLERDFDAPRELVWKTWTDPALLPRWYGPGAETIVHRLEVKPGGLWLGEMRWGDNANYQRVEYTEVIPPERLVWLHSVTDADWQVISNPMMADWPRVLLTTVTFEDAGGRTRLRLTWVPHEASQAEIACFAAPPWMAWTRAGAPAWSCSQSCWPNCRPDNEERRGRPLRWRAAARRASRCRGALP